MIKKVVALFLVLLLSIESFAAVVSDNDGSAFITKAEFDSLKNDFQSQIDQYNTSIDAKIDGAIAAYLAGVKVTKTVELVNNLTKLQNSYTVYWTDSTTALARTRVNYGSEYQIQIGARGGTYLSTDAYEAQATSRINTTYVNFPIVSKGTADDGSEILEINYWEQRVPWITYCGFFIANTAQKTQFMESNIFGIFSTFGFNPNTNDIFKRQDQWWWIDGADNVNARWAMSIWAIYSTKVNTRDNIIRIHHRAGNCYVWNESETAKSTGQDDNVLVPNITNNGRWSGTAPNKPTYWSNNLNVYGYTKQETATFPWCHTQYDYKTLYDARISTITGVKAPLSEGLLISEGKGTGTLTIYGRGTRAGSLEIKIKDKNNTTILKQVTQNIGTTRTKFTVDLKDLETGKDFNIWVKYFPNSAAGSTTGYQLYVDSIYFESYDE